MVEPSRNVPDRFAGLPLRRAFGIEFPVAVSVPARLRGLAFLDLQDAGPGLLIPGCRSVHTVGMRFPIDVWFLDREGSCISLRRAVAPCRVVADRRATGVLETPPDLITAPQLPAEPARGGRERAGRD